MSSHRGGLSTALVPWQRAYHDLTSRTGLDEALAAIFRRPKDPYPYNEHPDVAYTLYPLVYNTNHDMNLVEYHIVLLADQQFDTPHAKGERHGEYAPVDLMILVQQ